MRRIKLWVAGLGHVQAVPRMTQGQTKEVHLHASPKEQQLPETAPKPQKKGPEEIAAACWGRTPKTLWNPNPPDPKIPNLQP